MKLIDAPIGIFRFDGELVLKTEYCSENKLSGKYIPDCYIVRTGEYFWGSAKTANELNNLDVEPVDFAELLPIVTDTISRQAAIDALAKNMPSWTTPDGSGQFDHDIQVTDEAYVDCMQIIHDMPSAQPAPSQVAADIARIVENEQDMRVIAQPERIKGHWTRDNACSECGCQPWFSGDIHNYNFCPHCGADMREVTE